MSALWLHLTQLPLFWLTLTLLVYMAVQWLYQRTRSFPLLNPVLLSIVVLVTLLYLTDTPYDTYFAGSQFIHFLLGPATVALAIPLYLTLGRIRQLFLPIVAALVVGCITGILSAIWLSQWLGASDVITLSLAPKSVTTPIAMGVTEQIGGLPSLTAVLVILTGVVGGVIGIELLSWCHIRSPAIQGFAIGLASHGIGTARSLQISAEAGAFAGLAMGLNGALTAILVPLIVNLLL